MATLSVLKFDDPYGADLVLTALEGLLEQGTIELEDAAVELAARADEVSSRRH